MQAKAQVLAIIPARGGSKGIPGKNLAPISGHPLIAWSIFAARQATMIDDVLVTTDCPDIAAAAKDYGAGVTDRPAALATDEAGVFEVVVDLRSKIAQSGAERQVVAVLEPTSPFRTPGMLDACIAPVLTNQADSLATFRECRTNPHRAWTVSNKVPTPFLENSLVWKRRQELPDAFEISGEVYVFDWLQLDLKSRSFLFGRQMAHIIAEGEGIDIDRPLDLEMARWLMKSSETSRLAPPPS